MDIIKRFNEVHKNKYIYSKVAYHKMHEKVCIICPEHGEFWQLPYVHLNGCGCPKCGGVFRYDTKTFIDAAKEIHKGKYDYSKVEYINNKIKVCILCPEHGEFWQTPHMHLHGQGCPMCGAITNSEKRKMSESCFIKKAKNIHCNKYDYSKVNYVNTDTKVCIICPEHGEFWQTPHMHLGGNGCPKCKQSHMERKIQKILNDNNIQFSYNTKPFFLNGLESDFTIQDKNIIIECQGSQHFLKNHFFEPLETVINRDIRKKALSTENGYSLLYVFSKKYKEIAQSEQFNHMYDDALFIEDIEKDNTILINKIKSEILV